MKATEHQEQCAVMEWAQVNENKLPGLCLLHAIPNGGLRNKRVAVKLKAEGVKPGVPDLFLPVARDGYYGMYIEMKAQGGRLRDNQKEWLDALADQGYLAIVCYGAQEAIEAITDYLTSCKTSECKGVLE